MYTIDIDQIPPGTSIKIAEARRFPPLPEALALPYLCVDPELCVVTTDVGTQLFGGSCAEKLAKTLKQRGYLPQVVK